MCVIGSRSIGDASVDTAVLQLMEPMIIADFIAMSATDEWQNRVPDINAVFTETIAVVDESKSGAPTARLMTTVKKKLKEILSNQPRNTVRVSSSIHGPTDCSQLQLTDVQDFQAFVTAWLDHLEVLYTEAVDGFNGDAREAYLDLANTGGKRCTDKISLTVATSLEQLFAGQSHMIIGMLAIAEKMDVWTMVDEDNDPDDEKHPFLFHVKDTDTTDFFTSTYRTLLTRFKVRTTHRTAESPDDASGYT